MFNTQIYNNNNKKKKKKKKKKIKRVRFRVKSTHYYGSYGHFSLVHWIHILYTGT